ncbi:hypothetical protein [Streptomyces sp. NPDC048340]|uniref:hypothetical protein n=1 Tax=Streptomyces sp. NPDC048340 TaxID=3365537 RepID=UPI00371A623A
MSRTPSPRCRPRAAGNAEAYAWAEVLVRHGLLYAALPTPTGQWLVQDHPDSSVRVLPGPTALVELAAEVQRRIRRVKDRRP